MFWMDLYELMNRVLTHYLVVNMISKSNCMYSEKKNYYSMCTRSGVFWTE